MDLNVLPLAEIDLQIGDDAIKFDSDEGKEDFSEINPSFNPEIFDPRNDVHFIKQEVENYEGTNYHFLTSNHQNSDRNKPTRRYLCEECGRYFNRNDHLKNHMRTHTGERPYTCEFCQRSFAKNYDLSRHKQYVHGSINTFFSCEECGRTFTRKDHLKSHLINHKNQALKSRETNNRSPPVAMDRFVCKTCGRTYCKLEYLKKHMQKHSENIDSTNCDLNNLVNDLKSEDITEEKHIQNHSENIDSTNCDLNNLVNDLKSDDVTEKMVKGINFHFMSPNEVEVNALKPYLCKYCGRMFIRKDHLANHERTHTGEKPYKCEHCDKRFTKRYVMTRHLENIHRIETRMHSCPKCDRKFKKTDRLNIHMKIHTKANKPQNEKIHECDVCGKKFTRSDNLKTHVKIHLLAEVRKVHEEEMGNVEGRDEFDGDLWDMKFSDFEEFQKHEEKLLKMQTS